VRIKATTSAKKNVIINRTTTGTVFEEKTGAINNTPEARIADRNQSSMKSPLKNGMRISGLANNQTKSDSTRENKELLRATLTRGLG